MPSPEGPNSPGGSNAGSIGSGFVGWSNAVNVAASDNSYASGNTFTTPAEVNVYLSKNAPAGTEAGDNKSTAATMPATDAYVSYGASNNLWGQTWTPAEINSSNFGPLFRVTNSQNHYSHGYGFAIPGDATIDGILVEIEQSYSGTTARIDHVRITVYYTEGGGGGAASRLTKYAQNIPHMHGNNRFIRIGR